VPDTRLESAAFREVEGLVDRELPQTQELARRILGVAVDKQASDVVLLDARGVCSFADYFLICTGESDRQMEAINASILTELKGAGVKPHHCEGDAHSGWMVLDLGDIVVHIFAPFEREYYQLEQLWGAAPVLVRAI